MTKEPFACNWSRLHKILHNSLHNISLHNYSLQNNRHATRRFAKFFTFPSGGGGQRQKHHPPDNDDNNYNTSKRHSFLQIQNFSDDTDDDSRMKNEENNNNKSGGRGGQKIKFVPVALSRTFTALEPNHSLEVWNCTTNDGFELQLANMADDTSDEDNSSNDSSFDVRIDGREIELRLPLRSTTSISVAQNPKDSSIFDIWIVEETKSSIGMGTSFGSPTNSSRRFAAGDDRITNNNEEDSVSIWIPLETWTWTITRGDDDGDIKYFRVPLSNRTLTFGTTEVSESDSNEGCEVTI